MSSAGELYSAFRFWLSCADELLRSPSQKRSLHGTSQGAQIRSSKPRRRSAMRSACDLQCKAYMSAPYLTCREAVRLDDHTCSIPMRHVPSYLLIGQCMHKDLKRTRPSSQVNLPQETLPRALRNTWWISVVNLLPTQDSEHPLFDIPQTLEYRAPSLEPVNTSARPTLTCSGNRDE